MRQLLERSMFAWLVRDTFRQSLASGIFWILLGTSTLCTLLCLSVTTVGDVPLSAPGENPDFLPRFDPHAKNADKVRASGVTVVSGELSLGFGALRVPLARDRRTAVHHLQLILAGGVADTLGLLLTLVWTAGFLPGFLDPRSVSVLLAKPMSRFRLLLSKYAAVLVFVLFHATVFVLATWLALGGRTGVWDASYLLSVPLLLLHFAIFYSFSLLLAVCARSTVVCVFGSLLFWCLCWGMNYGRHAVMLAAKLAPESAFSGNLARLADLGYWLLPKPADLGMLLYQSLDAQQYVGQIFDPAALAAAGSFSLALSVLSSLAFMVYALIAAGRQFATTDY
jgi:hypothetical protein